MKYAMTVYILSAGAALAHGGHEAAVTEGYSHWFTSGDHMVVLVLAAFAAGLGLREVIRALRRILVRA